MAAARAPFGDTPVSSPHCLDRGTEYTPPRCPVVLPHSRKHVVLILESLQPLLRNAESHSQGGARTAPPPPLPSHLAATPPLPPTLLGSEPGTGQQGPRGSPGRRRPEPPLNRMAPGRAALSSSHSRLSILFTASFYSRIYDFHSNGFHSTSSTPTFLITVVQAL